MILIKKVKVKTDENSQPRGEIDFQIKIKI